MKRTIGNTALLAALALGSAAPVSATMVFRRVPLEESAAKADRIVHARVIDVRVGRDGYSLPSTWITLEVIDVLKGRAGARMVFKQFGNGDGSQANVIGRIPELPVYKVGDEIVVFLRRRSGRGFTSPVGLEDGVFHVTDGKVAGAASGNRGRTEETVDQFLATVRSMPGVGR